MNPSSRSTILTFTVVLVLAALAQAQTFTTLYSFTESSSGFYPYAGLIQDPAGNLYGTTNEGGDLNCYWGYGYGCGVVFEVNTTGTETVLHNFSGRLDGTRSVAPVARDKAGNLYGTTSFGGSDNAGTVFKIGTAGHETVLYTFKGGSNSCCAVPSQGLIVDKSGAVFGTTLQSGSSGYGTIFKVDSAGKFTLLHHFAGGSSDGNQPSYGHLTMDKYGNLYGLTEFGGAGIGCVNDWGCGVLYKLSKSGTLTILHSFAGGTTDGCEPTGTVVQDKYGNLYGTAGCGSNNHGTIWKVSPKGKETILYNFAGGTSDGCGPVAGVTRDSKGNLYGVTAVCGANNLGVLYKLSASRRLTLLHSFAGYPSDGSLPVGEVLRTTTGTLYGTTVQGGTYDAGTVWSYVP